MLSDIYYIGTIQRLSYSNYLFKYRYVNNFGTVLENGTILRPDGDMVVQLKKSAWKGTLPFKTHGQLTRVNIRILRYYKIMYTIKHFI